MSGRPKQTFLQRRHTDGQQAHEKMLTSLTVREIQIKTTMRYNLTLSSKSLQIINAGEGVEKKEPFHIIGGSVNWCSHHGRLWRRL